MWRRVGLAAALGLLLVGVGFALGKQLKEKADPARASELGAAALKTNEGLMDGTPALAKGDAHKAASLPVCTAGSSSKLGTVPSRKTPSAPPAHAFDAAKISRPPVRDPGF
ncbi:MAG TPA: hypothetical protein VGL13_04785 [Polyangiaceae bacterium]